MKVKFSIRDLLFVILLAAVSAAWITDRNKIAVERKELVVKDSDLKVKAKLLEAKERHYDAMIKSLTEDAVAKGKRKLSELTKQAEEKAK